MRTHRRLTLALALALSPLGCDRDADDTPRAEPAALEPPGPTGQAPPAAPAAAPVADPVAIIATKRSYSEALDYALPLMVDTAENVSGGAQLFSLWSAWHLRWADVAVARDETSFARVRKDSDAERGKRMCVRGRVIEIQKQAQDLVPKSIFVGGMFIGAGYDVARFLAVASTGDLVSSSPARFCGVVAGRLSYANSGGGMTHAISMVGMFDLPENR